MAHNNQYTVRGNSVGKDAAAFLVGIIYLAVLFVLVRPGSQGPSFVNAISDGLTNLINAGTGGGGWSGNGPQFKAGH